MKVKSKKCRKCNKKLTSLNCTYYRLRNHIYLCNNCDREEKRKWAEVDRKRNKTKYALRQIEYVKRRSIENPVKYKCSRMFSGSKKRAKMLSIPHDVTSLYLESIAPEYCPALKIKINYSSKKKEKDSPSLDRIDSNKGYTKDNVQIISYLANLMKSYANKEELTNFANWVLNN